MAKPCTLNFLFDGKLASGTPMYRLHHSRLLIVDDIETNRMIVSHMLRKEGYTNIRYAPDGIKALELMEIEAPDIIIMDICMPNMDGLELCRKIREIHSFRYIPIIVLTALNEEHDKTSMFDLGASDFLSKPVQAGDLCCRVKLHLENKFLLEDLSNYRQRISHELAIARSMQDRILPTHEKIQALQKSYRLQLDVCYQPSAELGGDCWGIYPLSNSRLGVFIYDFSGHGVAASLNVFRLHALIADGTLQLSDPGTVLTSLNQTLCAMLSPSEYATMFYGVIDTNNNQLVYACAATPDPLVVGTDGKTQTLSGRGHPLGVTPSASYPSQIIPFYPGQTLFLYSDALIETLTGQRGYIDINEIIKTLEKKSETNNTHAIMQSVRRLYDHQCSNQQIDDLTLLSLTRLAQ